MPSLFIFGLGYVGQHLGYSLLKEGWRVSGTTRTHSQANHLKQKGFGAIVWDGTTRLPGYEWEEATHFLICVPPTERGDKVLAYHHFPTTSLLWVGYLSATSVYGDHQGAWVTEKSSLKGISPRSEQRMAAEKQWLETANILPAHVFRLSGIYGPGRSVLDSIRAGTAQRIDKPGHVFSRIHIDDIITILKASMKKPCAGEIYNLADDEPATSADVVAYGCQLLGINPPPLISFQDAILSERLREFYADHKRVSNTKVKESLGIQLIHPTYREGLRHC